MRFDSVRLKGIGPFVDEVFVDFSAIAGKLIAITGENGSGKSTLVECLPGALHRSTPTRGSLADLATGRDSFVEVRAVNGASYLVRQMLDNVSGKGESLILDVVGAPVLTDTKVRSYDTWAASHLPSPEVLFASTFAAQQAGGFLDLKATDRKSILLRILGVERLEKQAEQARERARDSRVQLESLVARMKDEQDRGLDVAEAKLQLIAARLKAQHADLAVRTADAELTAAKETAPNLAAKIAQEEANLLKAAQLKVEAAALATKFGDLDTRIKNNDLVLRDADSIRSASARLPVLVTELAALRDQIASLDAALAKDDERLRSYKALRAQDQDLTTKLSELARRIAEQRVVLEHAPAVHAAAQALPQLTGQLTVLRSQASHVEALRTQAQGDQNAIERQLSEVARRGGEAKERIVAATGRLADRTKVHDAVRGLEALRQSARNAALDETTIKAAIDEFRGSLLHGAERRLSRMRPFVERVADGQMTVGGASDEASDVIREDDFLVKETALAPAQIAKEEAALVAARKALGEVVKNLQQAEILAARAADIEAAEGELRSANSVLAQAETDARTFASELDGARSRLETAIANHAKVAKAIEEITGEHERLAIIAARASELAVAEARIAEISTQVVAVEAAQYAVRESIAEAVIDVTGADARMFAANEALRETKGALTAGTAEHARLVPVAGLLVKLEVAEARIAELTPQREAVQAQSVALRDQIVALEPDPGQQLTAGPQPEELVALAKAALERAQESAKSAHGMIAVATARVESAELSKRKLTELDEERSVVETDLADWTLLTQSLGKDGVQALLVDAAGPELTELINDLLRTCVGTRWTVSIETTRASSDGKKQIEGCEVRVLDTERGRDANAETLSGGERVLVGEAVSLALSMLACRRSGVVGPSIIRDETGAALDPVNGRNYVQMLRRAGDLVGASQIFFISHSPDMAAMADACIHVADGKVQVLS